MASDCARYHGQTALTTAMRPPQLALILLIKAYRLMLSPILGPHCRFQPTCSAYAIEALERHGLLKGGWLAMKRLARCHPITWLGAGQGFDPVPEPRPADSRIRDV
jgi:uncharacterized protein